MTYVNVGVPGVKYGFEGHGDAATLYVVDDLGANEDGISDAAISLLSRDARRM